MKAQLLALAMMFFVWAMPGFTQETQVEEQSVSPEDLENMALQLEQGADVDTRGFSHAGTITEIHHNLMEYRSRSRSTCIKMNPPISGTWACLYLGSVDPVVYHTRGVDRGASAVGDYNMTRGQENIDRLLHDAFINKLRCTIWGNPPSKAGYKNTIYTISCYNQ